MMKKLDKVLVVGAGITGALTSQALRNEVSKVVVWDKAKGAGGRMSTSRSAGDPSCTADLGAQYISATPEDHQRHQRYYDDLLSASVLVPLKATIEGEIPQEDATSHFVTPKGISSLVKHYLSKSGVPVHYDRKVKNLSIVNQEWEVTTEKGQVESFDGIVLTIPVPQVLQLTGHVQEIIANQPDIKDKLEKVQYSSRYAMALFYKPGTSLSYSWGAKYFDDHCIRFVSIDNKKRGIESAEVGPSVVVHTTVKFGLDNLEGNMDTVCSNMVLPRLRSLLPDLPVPDRVKNLKWRYSQVYKSYEGSPGAIVLHQNPLLICAGDAFTRSRFDACIDSAEKAAECIKQSSKS